MNKSELIEAMAKQTGMSKKDTEAGLNAFCDVVKKELSNKKGDKKVQLVGFGTFEVSERAARQMTLAGFGHVLCFTTAETQLDR